jgi:molybdopterin-guanine dinucleotide biosynthesis protein A
VNAFVLAGGQSARMGRDKTLLEINGRPLVEHALDLLRNLDLNPRICGSRPDLARFAPVVPDNFPRSGPLAGIEAALAVSDTELNLFVPVDLPGLRREFLHWMLTRAERSREASASLGEAIDEFDVESVASALVPTEWPWDPPLADWFRNANTPTDYESLRAVLEQKAVIQNTENR